MIEEDHVHNRARNSIGANHFVVYVVKAVPVWHHLLVHRSQIQTAELSSRPEGRHEQIGREDAHREELGAVQDANLLLEVGATNDQEWCCPCHVQELV